MTALTLRAAGARPRPAAAGIDGWLVPAVALLWCYTLYDILRTAVAGPFATAVRHASEVVGLERVTGIGGERAIQHAVLHVPWLVDACNVCYSLTHLLAPPIVFVWLYRRSPERFRVARNAFLALLGLALVCFWLFPVAPPRLDPGPAHLADTTHTLSLSRAPFANLVSTKNESAAPAWAGPTNPVAAMPSLHVGWAVWAALAVWPLLRRRSTRLLVGAYPAFMALSVLVTGNHWLLDAVAGAILAVVTLAVATRRPRPGRHAAPLATS